VYTIEGCPCCQSKESTARWAVVAPFLAYYAVGRSPFLCRLMECSNCSFRFFDVRLTPEEVDKLYSGYRGERYFAERHRWEPWYSRKVNDGIGGDPEEVAERTRALEAFLLPHLDQSEIETVLDYGGDRGQFIPPSLGAKKFVFELSDAVPVAGVERINSEQQLRAMRFDLIMAFGVLEHCSDPAEVLEKLRSYLTPGSLLCVGVPYERYGLGFAGKGTLYRGYLNALLHFPTAVVAVDFYSTIARVRLGGIPPLGLIKCHEHLNFFDERSMKALLERMGFAIIDSRIESIVKYPARVESLQILARA
jgi:SAM-dependent methyltransferase